MAIYIGKNKKIKNIFVNVNGEKKSISSAWVNKEGVATKVFQLENNENDPYEVAPANEYSDWNYTLDEDNNTITLNYYIGSKIDVIVYANYVIGGKIYKTHLKNSSGNASDYMFFGKAEIKTIKFSNNIDTSNVTNMSYMFYNCSALIELDISNFNTSNVISMSNMFNKCSSLTELDLTSFDTSNVTAMYNMFGGCSSLTNLDLSGFNTSKVTNMIEMFSGCSSLTELDLSSFNTSNIANMNYMFNKCSSLTELDLTSFDTSKVMSMYCMFYDCAGLIELDLTSFDTKNVTNMNNMFSNDSNLKTIYVANGKWSTAKATTTNMFKNCGTSSVTYK